MKKSIIGFLILLVALVAVSGCLDTTQKNNTTNTPDQQNKTSNQTKITPDQAKQIAIQFVDEPGITAGTPVLGTTPNGKEVYAVPLLKNGTVVGEIEIDAFTGENLGGAGGAP